MARTNRSLNRNQRKDRKLGVLVIACPIVEFLACFLFPFDS